MTAILSHSQCIKSEGMIPQWPLRNSNEGIFCLYSFKTYLEVLCPILTALTQCVPVTPCGEID